MSELLTVGDLANLPEFAGCTRQQISYAIQEHRIVPRQRAGIIRLFGKDQIAQILAALRRTMARDSALR